VKDPKSRIQPLPISTTACQIQRQLKDSHPQYSSSSYTQATLQARISELKSAARNFFLPRNPDKCIIIEDSAKTIFGQYYLRSEQVTGRNPFLQDDKINYELDSEEELAEAQGEDLNSNVKGSESDEEMLSQVEEGFLVSDGHLSSEEYNFSQQSQQSGDADARKQEIQLRREKYKENLHRAQLLQQGMQPTIQLEKLQDYQAVCFAPAQLPLQLVKPPKVEQNQEERLQMVKFEILVLVYRSLEAKGNLLEELYVKYRSKVSVAPEIKLIMMLGGSAMMFHLTNSMFKSALPNMNDVIKQNPDLVKNMMAAVQNTTRSPDQPAVDAPVGGTGQYEMQGPGVDISSLMGGIMMPPPPPMNTSTTSATSQPAIDDDDVSDIVSISGESTGGEVKEVNVDASKPKRTRRKKKTEINL